MALPGVLLVRLIGLNKVFKCPVGQTTSAGSGVRRWCATKSRRFEDPRAAYSLRNEKNHNMDLLKEFPEPKSLLRNTISRSLGSRDLTKIIQYNSTDYGGIMRATVKLSWPSAIEVEGFAVKTVDAEKIAAAAACHKLKEMGVIGPNNKLPRSSHRGLKGIQATFDIDDEPWPENAVVSTSIPREDSQSLPSAEEALSIFPKSKVLLTRVMQIATSSHNLGEKIRFSTTGGKLKTCRLTLSWPENMKFTATGKTKKTAEARAAALACMKLKELKLLDENNNPLKHAKYHEQKVKEAGMRNRLPVQLEIPSHLKDKVRDYLEQYPVATEVQTLWEEEEARGQQISDQEDEEYVNDAITGRRYNPLSEPQAQQLNVYLKEQWEKSNPGLSVELPVDSHRQRVVEAVKASRVVVIAGETGCGKTTRIPRFLMEDLVRGGDGARCNILVTQPRRISAVSVAHRVAYEMGPLLKDSVGYQVRLESRPPEHSGGAMLFLTVGVLLKKLKSNSSLTGISHVVVDEVHERDVNTDLLLALLRSSLKENPNLKVVLMSATGDNERLSQYFDGCPIVKVPGFMHPVKDSFLEDVMSEMGRPLPQEGDEIGPDADLVADVIEHVDKHGDPGAVLCFLPGWQDIKMVKEKLEERPRFSSDSHLILPLHSSLSVAEQQAVFQHPQMGQRKIVLATNIAETSITIDDIVHVVDAGTHKEHSYDLHTKVSCLDTVWISRSNVTQRKGRAGRCQPGLSYHLFPRKQLESMAPFPIPEILRTPLENLVLQAKIHSPDLKAEDFLCQVLDSPEKEAVRDAVRGLQDIGVLDKTEVLTPLGERVACMSCDPRLGKLMVLSSIFRCVLPVLSIAACLTREPFNSSLQNRALVRKAKESLSGSSHSDYLAFSRVVLCWRNLNHEDRREYMEQNTLSWPRLRFINGLMSQFSENLKEANVVQRADQCLKHTSLYNQHSHQDELLKAVLLAGFYPNLIRVKKGIVTKGHFRPNSLSFRTSAGPVCLHSSTVNRGTSQFPSRWLTYFYAVKSNGIVFMRDTSVVHPLALLLLTNCDITETVKGDQVTVALSDCPLVHCELPVDTWELLWEFRTSIHTMLFRNLCNPDSMFTHSSQDGKLISLLVELLNNSTEAVPFGKNHQPQ